MSSFKTLSDMGDVQGKKVLVRSELNTPIENGKVSDTYRIEKALPTLQWLSEKGARVIVTAHLGRNPEDSLVPVYEEMKKRFSSARFVKDLVGKEAKDAIDSLEDGEVLLLENVRSNSGEKENDEEFGKTLSSFADYYVNDAFGAAHRKHASIVGVPKHIPAFAGLLMEQEVKELQKGLSPSTPSIFILGGAKFETKEPLLEAVVERYDSIFIGGALANDFLKAKGLEVGESLVSEGAENAQVLLETNKIVLPVDVVVENKNGKETKSVEEVLPTDKIVDVGPQSVSKLCENIKNATFLIWNGPLGYYEGGYIESTQHIAKQVSEANAHSIIGGGDTVAAIRNLELEDKIGFVSTGGGAMLEFLVSGELPGVNILKSN